jgi:hypothetical protein
MAYTIGNKKNYDELLNERKLYKQKDGDVWKTYEDVKKYYDKINGKVTSDEIEVDAGIYFVIADWDKDVEKDNEYHGILNKKCEIKKNENSNIQENVHKQILKKIITESLSKNKYDKFPLSNLVKAAKYFPDFKEFSKYYSVYGNHGYYWHLTNNPNFIYSDKNGSRDMSSLAGDNESFEPGSIMVTSDFETWNDYYNKEDWNWNTIKYKKNLSRPYAVLMDLSDINPTTRLFFNLGRGFGNEYYLSPDKANKIKVIKILPIKNAKRLDKTLQNISPQSEEELFELWKYSNKV